MIKILKRLNVLLDGKQKRRMVLIIFLMLIGGILESLSISVVIPVMQAVIDPVKLMENKYAAMVYERLHLSSSMQLTMILMAALIVAFVLKNLFLFLQNVVQLRFVYTNQFATSRKLMINFMERKYEYYLNADTAVIQRNITSDVNNMYALILTILQFTSEIVVFICLAAVLLMVDAKMILSITALLLVMLIIIKKVLRPIMYKAGQDNQDYYSGLFKWINEAVAGIKEIKVANKENYFITEYAKCGAGYVNAVQKYNIFNAVWLALVVALCVIFCLLLILSVTWLYAFAISRQIRATRYMVIIGASMMLVLNRFLLIESPPTHRNMWRATMP